MGLLGQGGAAKVAGSKPAGPASFKTEDYIKALFGKASGINEAADTKAQGRKKEIVDRIVEAMGKYNAPLPDPRTFANASAGQVGREFGRGDIDPNMIDINQFFKDLGPGYGNPEEFLTEAEAIEMNQIAEELMDPTRYRAGGKAGAQRYTWDDAGYREALRQAIRGMPGMPGTPVQRPNPGQIGQIKIDTNPETIPFYPELFPPGVTPIDDPNDPLAGAFGKYGRTAY
jgi:hypothetical protein